MTLIEILLVLALVALIAGGVMSGTGALGGSRQRAAATLVLTAVRLAMTQANSNGVPVRIVFDIDQSRIWIEETRSRMLRSNTEDEDDLTAGAAAATEAENRAADEAKRIVEGPREPPPQFSPLPLLGVDPDDEGLGRALGGDVKFVGIQTEHDPEVRTEGRAYLYFWPGGGTEKAIVSLGRPDNEPVNVLVSALTGRAQIVRGEIEFERPDIDPKLGEREVE
jgi:general secretion pathway protein H